MQESPESILWQAQELLHTVGDKAIDNLSSANRDIMWEAVDSIIQWLDPGITSIDNNISYLTFIQSWNDTT